MNGGKKLTFHVLKKTVRFRCQTFPARRVTRELREGSSGSLPERPSGQLEEHVLKSCRAGEDLLWLAMFQEDLCVS